MTKIVIIFVFAKQMEKILYNKNKNVKFMKNMLKESFHKISKLLGISVDLPKLIDIVDEVKQEEVKEEIKKAVKKPSAKKPKKKVVRKTKPKKTDNVAEVKTATLKVEEEIIKEPLVIPSEVKVENEVIEVKPEVVDEETIIAEKLGIDGIIEVGDFVKMKPEFSKKKYYFSKELKVIAIDNSANVVTLDSPDITDELRYHKSQLYLTKKK